VLVTRDRRASTCRRRNHRDNGDASRPSRAGRPQGRIVTHLLRRSPADQAIVFCKTKRLESRQRSARATACGLPSSMGTRASGRRALDD
jgi:hypothetical protein